MKKNKLATNMIYQIIYQGVAFIYPLITIPLISRAFGSETLGIYSYTYTIAYYFSLISGLGINTYGSRIVSINRDSEENLKNVFWELYLIQFCCGILCFSIYTIFWILSNYQYKYVAVAQGILILSYLIDVSWFFNGLEQFKTMVLRNIFIKIVSLVLIFWFIKTPEDIYRYVLLVAGTNLLGQAAMWPLLIKYVGGVRIRLEECKRHIKPVVHLFLPVIALNSYALIDKTLLGWFRTMEEVGFYENTDRIIKMPINIVNAVCAVLLPRTSINAAQGKVEENNTIIEKAIMGIFLFIVPIVGGVIAIAPELVPWYMGKEFSNCIVYISLLAPVILVMTGSSILRMLFFIPRQLDSVYTKAIVGSAGVNLVLNYILVKPYGVYGIIVATIIAEITGLSYLLYKCNGAVRYRRIVVVVMYYAVSVIPMYVIVRAVGLYMGAHAGTNMIQILVGAFVYFVMILLGYGLVKRMKKYK